MSELRPCPFCGGEATLQPRAEGKLVVFHCDPDGSCGGSWLGTYGHAEHMESAIAAWNTRAADAELDSLRAEVERLRAYARHRISCAVRFVPIKGPPRQCDCGLEQAIGPATCG